MLVLWDDTNPLIEYSGDWLVQEGIQDVDLNGPPQNGTLHTMVSEQGSLTARFNGTFNAFLLL